MATQDEKNAAVRAAVNKMSSEDRSDSVKRFVVMFDAMAALLPPPTPPPPAPETKPDATLVVTFKPTDEIRPDVERINKELWALIKKVDPSQPA